ncbi:MAG: large subunit ribosomal protein [Patescibacteria group bacterium]|jgi:large subunit ribosomal protein L6|nr:large subunit ribosomal protein [Patescibacteria group bacterium]
MSRVGKQQLEVPANTTVDFTGGVFTVKGPLGTLSKVFTDTISITIENNVVSFAPKKDDPFSRALWGTYASHVKNMLAGVNTPYVRKLILEGVGFKSEVKGKDLNLALGFSHPVVVPIPEGLTVTAEKNNITVTGIDKELVGAFTAKVRALKKPEPYKGKGFRYDDEVIRRKAGKKTA